MFLVVFLVWVLLVIGALWSAGPVFVSPMACTASPEDWRCVAHAWQGMLGAFVGLTGLMLVEVIRTEVQRLDRQAAARASVRAQVAGMHFDVDRALINLQDALGTLDHTAGHELQLSTAQRAALIRLSQGAAFKAPEFPELLGGYTADLLAELATMDRRCRHAVSELLAVVERAAHGNEGAEDRTVAGHLAREAVRDLRELRQRLETLATRFNVAPDRQEGVPGGTPRSD
jgi:hypothetical protein